MSDLKKHNKLDYSKPKEYSLAHQQRYYSARSPSKTASDDSVIECVVSVGDNDFVECKHSYVSFKFKGTSGTGTVLPFGTNGSVMNCFKTIQLIANDGSILDTYNYVSTYAANKFIYGLPINEASNYTTSILYSGAPAANTFHPVVVPMSLIMPLFKCTSLLPPSIMNGLRLRFTLAKAYEIFQDPVVRDWAVEVTDFKSVFNVFRMDKMAMEQIKKEKNVLQIETYHHKQEDFPVANQECNFSVPIHFQCAKATRAWSIVLEEAQTFNGQFGSSYIVDITSETFPSIRWKIGQAWTEPLETEVEQWNRSVATMLPDRTNLTSQSNHRNLNAIDLTRSAIQKGGTPIDNNNELVFQGKISSTSGAAMLNVHVFLEYAKIIHV